ncbi:unnamed protein product [Musa banksii]
MMERKLVAVCVAVGFLGLLSAEATRIKPLNWTGKLVLWAFSSRSGLMVNLYTVRSCPQDRPSGRSGSGSRPPMGFLKTNVGVLIGRVVLLDTGCSSLDVEDWWCQTDGWESGFFLGRHSIGGLQHMNGAIAHSQCYLVWCGWVGSNHHRIYNSSFTAASTILIY